MSKQPWEPCQGSESGEHEFEFGGGYDFHDTWDTCTRCGVELPHIYDRDYYCNAAAKRIAELEAKNQRLSQDVHWWVKVCLAHDAFGRSDFAALGAYVCDRVNESRRECHVV